MGIPKVFYRSPHNYDLELASNEAVAPHDPVSLTVQSQSEDADINVMMRRFGVTGQLPQGVRVPSYGDFTSISDYRSALHQIREAGDNFMKLPPDLRARYDNDPQLFLEAVASGEALPALKALGVATPVAPPSTAAPAASA
jgi:hypothetical protein